MESSKLPITGPCPIDLDAIGFDRKSKRSHCSHCVKSVHILSNMTEREAKDFLREKAGQKICVSYARDTQGKIRFKPEPEPAALPTNVVPLSRLRKRPSKTAAIAAAGLGLAAALAACTPYSQSVGEAPVAEQVEGKVAIDPPDEKEPCNKPEDPFEQVDGEIAVEPEPRPLAGAAVIPEPVEMLEGDIAVPELEEPQDEPEFHARGEIAPPTELGQ